MLFAYAFACANVGWVGISGAACLSCLWRGDGTHAGRLVCRPAKSKRVRVILATDARVSAICGAWRGKYLFFGLLKRVGKVFAAAT